jgi:hypothetical protein
LSNALLGEFRRLSEKRLVSKVAEQVAQAAGLLKGGTGEDSFDHASSIAQNSACGVVNLAAARKV